MCNVASEYLRQPKLVPTSVEAANINYSSTNNRRALCMKQNPITHHLTAPLWAVRSSGFGRHGQLDTES
jgi:hypothetical protein